MTPLGKSEDLTKTSGPECAARLLDLPLELIFKIIEYISLDDDLNCLSKTCHSLFRLANPELYKRSSQQHNFALLWAVATSSAATVRTALRNGAKVNAEAGPFKSVFDDISKRRRSSPVNLKHICFHIRGKPPLILAAEIGDPTVVRLLMEVPGICLSITASEDRHRWSPLMLAADRGNFRAVELLLNGCEMDAAATDSNGRTALHLAATNGHTRTVKMLLRNPHTNVEARDKHEDTPLHLALKYRHLPTVTAILDQSPGWLDIGHGHLPARLIPSTGCRRRLGCGRATPRSVLM